MLIKTSVTKLKNSLVLRNISTVLRKTQEILKKILARKKTTLKVLQKRLVSIRNSAIFRKTLSIVFSFILVIFSSNITNIFADSKSALKRNDRSDAINLTEFKVQKTDENGVIIYDKNASNSDNQDNVTLIDGEILFFNLTWVKKAEAENFKTGETITIPILRIKKPASIKNYPQGYELELEMCSKGEENCSNQAHMIKVGKGVFDLIKATNEKDYDELIFTITFNENVEGKNMKGGFAKGEITIQTSSEGDNTEFSFENQEEFTPHPSEPPENPDEGDNPPHVEWTGQENWPRDPFSPPEVQEPNDINKYIWSQVSNNGEVGSYDTIFKALPDRDGKTYPSFVWGASFMALEDNYEKNSNAEASDYVVFEDTLSDNQVFSNFDAGDTGSEPGKNQDWFGSLFRSYSNNNVNKTNGKYQKGNELSFALNKTKIENDFFYFDIPIKIFGTNTYIWGNGRYSYSDFDQSTGANESTLNVAQSEFLQICKDKNDKLYGIYTSDVKSLDELNENYSSVEEAVKKIPLSYGIIDNNDGTQKLMINTGRFGKVDSNAQKSAEGTSQSIEGINLYSNMNKDEDPRDVQTTFIDQFISKHTNFYQSDTQHQGVINTQKYIAYKINGKDNYMPDFGFPMKAKDEWVKKAEEQFKKFDIDYHDPNSKDQNSNDSIANLFIGNVECSETYEDKTKVSHYYKDENDYKIAYEKAKEDFAKLKEDINIYTTKINNSKNPTKEENWKWENCIIYGESDEEVIYKNYKNLYDFLNIVTSNHNPESHWRSNVDGSNRDNRYKNSVQTIWCLEWIDETMLNYKDDVADFKNLANSNNQANENEENVEGVTVKNAVQWRNKVLTSLFFYFPQMKSVLATQVKVAGINVDANKKDEEFIREIFKDDLVFTKDYKLQENLTESQKTEYLDWYEKISSHIDSGEHSDDEVFSGKADASHLGWGNSWSKYSGVTKDQVDDDFSISGLVLKYRTIMTDTSKPTLSNKLKVTVGGENFSIDQEYKYKFSAGIWGDEDNNNNENEDEKGNIKLTKVDGDSTDKKLTGAEFSVYDKDNKKVGNLLEDKNKEGIYEIKDLPLGKYVVKETKAPEGYTKDDGSYEVNILEKGKTYIVENNSKTHFFTNKLNKEKDKVGGIRIIKTSSDGKIEGFSFKVTGPNNYSKIFKTDSNGEIKIEGLTLGTYTISEVEDDVSKDYILPEDKVVQVEKDITAIVSMYNEKTKVSGSTDEKKDDTTDQTKKDDSKIGGTTYSPKTGENENIYMIMTLAIVSIGGLSYKLLLKNIIGKLILKMKRF
jgi:hypothetical protein